MFLNNKKNQKSVRRDLRNGATPQEVVLWSRLKHSQLGFKFRRQFSVGNYVMDFYCPQKRLAIEIDGSQHIDSEPDRKRTDFLNAQNIQVLRFWNNEIDTNIAGVLLKICTFLEDTGKATTPLTPPWKGGEEEG